MSKRRSWRVFSISSSFSSSLLLELIDFSMTHVSVLRVMLVSLSISLKVMQTVWYYFLEEGYLPLSSLKRYYISVLESSTASLLGELKIDISLCLFKDLLMFRLMIRSINPYVKVLVLEFIIFPKSFYYSDRSFANLIDCTVAGPIHYKF